MFVAEKVLLILVISLTANNTKTKQTTKHRHIPWDVLGKLIHALQWRHNGRDGVSNHWREHCLLSRFFSSRSKKTSKFRVTGLCPRNSPVTGEFPIQKASNAKKISIGWHHHRCAKVLCTFKEQFKIYNKKMTCIFCQKSFIQFNGKIHDVIYFDIPAIQVSCA